MELSGRILVTTMELVPFWMGKNTPILQLRLRNIIQRPVLAYILLNNFPPVLKIFLITRKSFSHLMLCLNLSFSSDS